MDSLPPPGFYRATGSDPLSSTSSTFNPPPQPNVLQLLSPTASYIFSLLPAGLPLVITPPFNAVTDTAPERMQIREINFENEGEYGAHIGDLISHIHTNRIPPGDAFVYKKKMSQSILWLRDFDLKTTFLGSTAYHDIPGVIEYQDQTTVENLANSASAATSRKLGSTKPDNVLVTRVPGRERYVYHILEYKYSSVQDPQYRANDLNWLRREGTYQTMWYLYIASQSPRFRRRQGTVLINNRYMPLAVHADGSILAQGRDTLPETGIECSVQELDDNAEFWSTNFGTSLVDAEGAEQFFASIQASLFHAAIDDIISPAAQTRLLHAERVRLNSAPNAMALIMKKKNEIHAGHETVVKASQSKSAAGGAGGRSDNMGGGSGSSGGAAGANAGRDGGPAGGVTGGGQGRASTGGADRRAPAGGRRGRGRDSRESLSNEGPDSIASNDLDSGSDAANAMEGMNTEDEDPLLDVEWFRQHLVRANVKVRLVPPSVMRSVSTQIQLDGEGGNFSTLAAGNMSPLSPVSQLTLRTPPSPTRADTPGHGGVPKAISPPRFTLSREVF